MVHFVSPLLKWSVITVISLFSHLLPLFQRSLCPLSKHEGSSLIFHYLQSLMRKYLFYVFTKAHLLNSLVLSCCVTISHFSGLFLQLHSDLQARVKHQSHAVRRQLLMPKHASAWSVFSPANSETFQNDGHKCLQSQILVWKYLSL